MQTRVDEPVEAGARDPGALGVEAARLRASGALGRSATLLRLFDYLAERSLADRPPKEIELAMDVFGRSAAFDGAQDSVVRVYVHKLRARLQSAYAGALATAPRIAIPRGEYRMVLEVPPSLEPLAPRVRHPRLRTIGAAILGILTLMAASSLATWWWLRPRPTEAERQLALARRSAVWGPVAADRLPTLLVLGDYFLVGESENGMDVRRLVREYDINSTDDLDNYLMIHPEKIAKYIDVGLRYLPTSVGEAIHDITPMLASGPRSGSVRVVLASDLTPEELKSNNIVYLGLLSGLSILRQVAFAGSRFSPGESFDEIVDSRTHHHYASQGGGLNANGTIYTDYGYVSSFGGPGHNRVVIVAGTRDVALLQMAATLATGAGAAEAAARSGRPDAFEALYQVEGMNQLNVHGRLLVAVPLDTAKIWTETTGASAP